MSTAVQKFLKGFEVTGDNVKFTHTSIIPRRKFFIPDIKITTLHKLIDKYFEKENIFLTEAPLSDGGPIKIDIDLKVEFGKVKDESVNHLYKPVHIKLFLKQYCEIMNQVLDLSGNKKYLAVVLEKEKKTKYDTYYKDGFHIMFPFIVTNYEVQHHIRKLYLEKYDTTTAFPKIENMEPLNKVIDEATVQRNNWAMYGCKTKEHSDPYLCTTIYKMNKNEKLDKDTFIEEVYTPDELFKNKLIVSILSIRNKKLNTTNKKNVEIIPAHPKPKIRMPKQEKETLSVSEIEFIKKLCTLLSTERATYYDTWIEVCWCLKNIGPNNEFYPLFIEFSKKCPKKFNQRDCQDYWIKARDDGDLGLGSLRYWAKSDAPEEYAKLMKELVFATAEKLAKGSVDIAEIVYKMYNDKFIYLDCLSAERKGWYEYCNHRWVKRRNGPEFRRTLTTEVHQLYINLYSSFKSKEIAAAEDSPERKVYEYKAKIASQIEKRLRDTPTLNHIMTECISLFSQRDFEERLDANPFLIGFNNGIFDLQHNKFRPGIPEDYISLCTGINYRPTSAHSDKVKEVMNFMNEILPNKEVREYFLKVAASCLDGINRDEKFYILTGRGRNGKSKVVQLIQEVLGQYTCALSIALITQKRSSAGNASPEIAKMKGKRLSVFKEPDNITDSILNVGMIKDLTGNDIISCRNLYENDNEFRVSSKIFLMCNQTPEVNADDDGAWDRIRIIPFPIHFCANPREPNDRLIDESIREKIPKWKEAFMSLLVEYYIKYRKEGLREPKLVLKATEEYRERNNVFMEFINENTEEKKGKFINIMPFYQIFRNWYTSSYGSGKRVPVKKEFLSFVKNYFGCDYNVEKGIIKHRIIVEHNDDGSVDELEK